MENKQSRREFIAAGMTAGTGLMLGCTNISCCAKLMRSKSQSREGTSLVSEEIDFNKLAYCSWNCDQKKCQVVQAFLNDDLEAKEKIVQRWSKKYGREFTTEEVFCYGCKTEDKPASYILEACTVRKCARGRNVITCAHCDELPACNKELWIEWPDLKKKVEELRSELQG